jgi:hypothetical protein
MPGLPLVSTAIAFKTRRYFSASLQTSFTIPLPTTYAPWSADSATRLRRQRPLQSSFKATFYVLQTNAVSFASPYPTCRSS